MDLSQQEHPRRASTIVINDTLCYDYAPRSLDDPKPWYCYTQGFRPYRATDADVASVLASPKMDAAKLAFRAAHPSSV